MTHDFLAACLQTNTTPDRVANLEQIEGLMARAHGAGADFVALPEACDFLHPDAGVMREYARPVAEHAALDRLSSCTRKYGFWTLIGSLTVRRDNGMPANRSFLLNPSGEIVTHYDKIHMFDANIPGDEGSRESDLYQAGDQACLAQTPWAKLGMTICYDLRFPQLYRSLGHAGADILTVPSAFAQMTGEAHWHSLLRARAIENTCFVIAPGQTGHHYKKRYSFGHSLIVDPWGRVLADGGDKVGLITARIDLDRIAEARAVISSLHHDREFAKPEAL